VSTPEVVDHHPAAVPLPRRLVVHAAVAVARLLATRRPAHIRAVLRRLPAGRRAATYDEVSAVRDEVTAVSLICAAREGCLPRSLAVVLLCRLAGCRVTWCVGVRRVAPFGAHAWVEVDGRMVDEPYPSGYFRPLFTEP
jgi:hypothetical protein